MSEAAAPTVDETLPAQQPAEPQLRDAASDFIEGLGAILLPTDGETVLFGDQKEPLRLSQIEGLTSLLNNVAHIREDVGDELYMLRIIQPGGTGKTREGVAAAYAMHTKQRNSLFVVPSQHSVVDFAGKAQKLCPDMNVGVVYQGEKRIGTITFITYSSLLRLILGEGAEAEAREFEEAQQQDFGSDTPATNINEERLTINPADYDLVIWDEAHMYLTAHAQQLLKRFKHAINVALTATPRYYLGKDVADVFTILAHEINLQIAIKRKEISDFRNILLSTDITTGLALSSPDQEESAEVARAIDIPDRNRIFADFYRNGEITVKGKKYTLFGEPAVVFGADINHVHDLADIFNESLDALRIDEQFRAALIAKNIDPDQVEQIAAPVHSGERENHSGMSLRERNAVIDRYHERKVLVLVGTSVLQQSFDSPRTSVVIDTVPRQTYVGVAQAGMRALRYLEKKMAFIINTQDEDHQSLSFQDFQVDRGREEGVSVEIAASGAEPRERAERTGSTAGYTVTYGTSLVDLAEKRKAREEALRRQEEEQSYRYFDTDEENELNQLILDMATGDRQKRDIFYGRISGWAHDMGSKVAQQFFVEEMPEFEELQDVCIDVVMHLLALAETGGIQSWGRFETRFRSDMRYRLQRMQLRMQLAPELASLDDDIPHIHRQSHLSEDVSREAQLINEPATVTLHEALPSKRYPEGHQESPLHTEEIHRVLNRSIEDMTELEREITLFRCDRTEEYKEYEDIARKFGITTDEVERVRNIALQKLRTGGRARFLRPFSEHEQKKRLNDEEQRKENNRVLWEIEEDLLPHRRVLFALLSACAKDGKGLVEAVSETTGIRRRLVKALCDVNWTDVNGLVAALDEDVVQRLYGKLHKLGVRGKKVTAFKEAVAGLQSVMARFVEMGGKPVGHAYDLTKKEPLEEGVDDPEFPKTVDAILDTIPMLRKDQVIPFAQRAFEIMALAYQWSPIKSSIVINVLVGKLEFLDLSESFRGDLECVLANQLSRHPRSEYVLLHAVQNKETVLKFLRLNGRLFKKTAPEMQMDRDCILAAVCETPNVFDDVDKRFYEDDEIAWASIGEGKYISPHLHEFPERLRMNRDFVLKAVRACKENFQHAPEQFKKDPEILAEMMYYDHRVIPKAMFNDPQFIEYVCAVSVEWLERFWGVPYSKDKSVALIAAKYMPAIRHPFKLLDASFADDEDVMLALVQRNGKFLRFGRERIRMMKHITIAALRTHPERAAPYVHLTLRDDPEIRALMPVEVETQ